MASIIDFLEARITEDEASAQAASAGTWEWIGDPAEDEAFLCNMKGDSVISAYGFHTEGYIECSDGDRTHIARWDPARVLAECAAKRAIAGLHKVGADQCDEHNAMFESVPCPTIRALAAVYKDHPDYHQEWA